MPEPAEKLVGDAERADPGAEEAAEKQGGDQDQQRQQQSQVEGAAGEEGGNRRERVQFQQQGRFEPLHAAEVGEVEQQQGTADH